ncbi:MAG: hypothetical protein P8049_02885 [Gemmatimonadota bacterium]
MHVRHFLIDHYDIEFLRTHEPKRFLCEPFDFNVVAFGGQHGLAAFEDARLVVHDEYLDRLEDLGVERERISFRITGVVGRLRFLENLLFQLVGLAHFGYRLPGAVQGRLRGRSGPVPGRGASRRESASPGPVWRESVSAGPAGVGKSPRVVNRGVLPSQICETSMNRQN